MPLAVAFYDVVLWLHILAFFIAFGPTYAYGVFFAYAAKAGPQAMFQTAKAVQMWDRVAVTAGSLLIIATGLYLTLDRWEFSDFFVSWGIVAVLFVLGVTHAYFAPRYRMVIEHLEAGREAEAQALGQSIGKVGTLLGVVVILTIYVMTAQPFL